MMHVKDLFGVLTMPVTLR